MINEKKNRYSLLLELDGKGDWPTPPMCDEWAFLHCFVTAFRIQSPSWAMRGGALLLPGRAWVWWCCLPLIGLQYYPIECVCLSVLHLLFIHVLPIFHPRHTDRLQKQAILLNNLITLFTLYISFHLATSPFTIYSCLTFPTHIFPNAMERLSLLSVFPMHLVPPA